LTFVLLPFFVPLWFKKLALKTAIRQTPGSDQKKTGPASFAIK
jgi:hypothetical protein